MAMASLQSDGFCQGKLTKSRKSIVVKPILKKLHAHSHSARNSLDLDRGWDDQPMNNSPDVEYGYDDYAAARDTDGFASDRRHLFNPAYTVAPGSVRKVSRPTRDVSFTGFAADLGSAPGILRRANTFSATTHARSTSGASAATPSTTNGRNGPFVHPFQQIPRTSTPPLSYANSVASLDTTLVSQQREHNSIAEDEGYEQSEQQLFSHLNQSSKKTDTSPPHPTAAPRPRRPSLTSSHRTSSQSDAGMSIRVPITRSNSATPVLRSVRVSEEHCHQDLQPSPGTCADDPFFPTTITTTPLTTSSPKAVSPTTSNPSPISPFRTSLDMNSFRIRSRNEIDTATRMEQVREARRKFEAKEREKEEKYAREEVRKRERADAKEAQKYERQQAQRRKSSQGHISVASQRNSAAFQQEKGPFAGDAAPEEEHFSAPSRSKSAKRKTNSLWTAFMLWLRTRFIKLARRKGNKIH